MMRATPLVRMVGATAVALALGTAVLLPAWGHPSAASRGPAGMTGGGDPAADTARMAAIATSGGMSMSDDTALARQLVAARLATAKYATNLAKAKADGYQIITKLTPDGSTLGKAAKGALAAAAVGAAAAAAREIGKRSGGDEEDGSDDG